MSVHIHSKIHDIIATIGVPTFLGLVSMAAVENVLKILGYILTIIFLLLGIWLRAKKIRTGEGSSEE